MDREVATPCHRPLTVVYAPLSLPYLLFLSASLPVEGRRGHRFLARQGRSKVCFETSGTKNQFATRSVLRNARR
jgi:hypothetical protein